MSLTRIEQFRRRFGGNKSIPNFVDYFALYLHGCISSETGSYNIIQNFKWTMMNIVVSFIMSSASLYFNSQLILDESLISFTFIMTFILSIGIDNINSVISPYINNKIKYEQINIMYNIRQFIHNKFVNACYKWKSKYTNSERFKALNDDIDELTFLTNGIFYLIDKIVNFVSIIIVSFSVSVHILIAVVIYIAFSIIEYKYNQLYTNPERTNDSNKLYNVIECQVTNQIDIDYSHGISKLYEKDIYDPTIGIYNAEYHQANYYYKNNKLQRCIFSFICDATIALYLYYVGIPKCIIFFIINKRTFNNILSFRHDLGSLSNNTSISKLIIMLNDIEILKPINIYKQNTFDVFQTKQFTISIDSIYQQITDNIIMKYDGKIEISSNDKIILLNGEKGSGKSLTVDILGGRYDDSITNGITYDTLSLSNEFRDLQEHIFYMRQCIMEDYRNNTQNTIIMSLSTLFPLGTLQTIREYLTDFKIEHKMPETLDELLCNVERGLSPGEMQSFLFASQFWKAKMLQPRIMIMDEPERNVDLSVIFNAMKTIMNKFNGIIVLITHSSDLKRFILPNVTQMWNYKDIRYDSKRVLTFDIVKDKTKMLELINTIIDMPEEEEGASPEEEYVIAPPN